VQGLLRLPDASRGAGQLARQRSIPEVEPLSGHDGERDEVSQGVGLDHDPTGLDPRHHVYTLHSVLVELLTLEHVGPTMTVNGSHTMHWSARAQIIKTWREDFGWLGLSSRIRVAETVGIEINVVQRSSGGLADQAGHALLAKAAIDGLVDGKVLRADDGAHVAWSRFWAPSRDTHIPKGRVKLILTLVPVQ